MLADELRDLGSTRVTPVPGGALFTADRHLACRAVFWLRSAVRVLEPIATGRALDFDQLYELASTARWEDLVGPRHTFAVHATVSNAPFKNRNFAALRVKDAVADRIRDKCGIRPDVDRRAPDVPIRLVGRGDDAHLFRDLAGDSLHRRGYRPVQVKSPLPEATAAGLLLMTGWEGRSPLLDPMCGSGTFVLEAAALLADRASGSSRSFAGERFPDADPVVWAALREEAADRLRSATGEVRLLGSDHHPGAIGIAREAARNAGLSRFVQFGVADVATFDPPFQPGLVVTNPPWGGRLGEGEELVKTWRDLGGCLRKCAGASAWVLSGAPELTRHLGLRASERHPLTLGPFDVRWLRYAIRERTAGA